MDPDYDTVFLHRPNLPRDAAKVMAAVRGHASTVPDVDAMMASLAAEAREGDHVVFRSNGGFGDAPRWFLNARGPV